MFDWDGARKRLIEILEEPKQMPNNNEVCSKCHEDFMNCKCSTFHPNIPVKYSWQVERKESVKILRQICARFGDNNWNDDLYLVDILDKHLWRHLAENGTE